MLPSSSGYPARINALAWHFGDFGAGRRAGSMDQRCGLRVLPLGVQAGRDVAVAPGRVGVALAQDLAADGQRLLVQRPASAFLPWSPKLDATSL